ncbi:MAG TPA: hypothetical protein VGQ20_05890 [Acidimicrobiales bacterium]|jgi:hypothetical protein|nr:hypothetical protein [Acidimicrobiales bacterium]
MDGGGREHERREAELAARNHWLAELAAVGLSEWDEHIDARRWKTGA